MQVFDFQGDTLNYHYLHSPMLSIIQYFPYLCVYISIVSPLLFLHTDFTVNCNKIFITGTPKMMAFGYNYT